MAPFDPALEPDPDLDLVLVRDLDAPRAALYACWTTPEHIMQWFVPKPHRVVACKLDPRPGGVFDTTFEVEGKTHENRGVYLEVVPNERLVFTDAYSAGWKPAPDPFMTAILRFEEIGPDRTRYTALVRHRNAKAAKTHRDMGFFDGWGTATTQLETLARGLAR